MGARTGRSATTTTTTGRSTTGESTASSSSTTTTTTVVGGCGRVGRLVVERLLLDDGEDDARRRRRVVRVMTRDGASETATRLRALGAEILVGDVLSERDCERACEGADEVVAAFGAQRIARASDAWRHVDVARLDADEMHPRAINYLGVRRLVECAERAGVRRFVRVTGMSVGYPAFDWIAVLLNVVLSMTIKWQAAGERAIRDACAASRTMTYCVVRPGSLSDDARCAEDATGKKRVVLGSGGARVHAGKISRADVADVIVEALRRPECADATICVAGAAMTSGGVRTELSWDPARGMHWRAVETEKTVKEGRSFRDESMWTDVAKDDDELKEKPHRRYVAAFLAFLAGVFVLLVNGLVTLARWFIRTTVL